MCVPIMLFVFGIAGLLKGEFRITSGRMVRGSIGRFLGLLMLIGAVLPFLVDYGAVIGLGILAFAIIIGLLTSERVERETMQSKKPQLQQRYFGMTTTQIGVLVVLATLACMVFAVGGKIILDRTALSGADVVEPVPQTPPLHPSPISTASPTPTLAPAPVLDPGWVLHQHPNDGFMIALPDSWVKMDLDAETIEDALAPVREYYPNMTSSLLEEQTIDEVRASGLRLAVDTELSETASTYLASVSVVWQSLDEATSLEETVQTFLEMYDTRGIEPVVHKRVNLPVGHAEEFRFTTEGSEGRQSSVQYLMVNEDIVCIITTSSEANSLEGYTPVFGKIVESFRWIESAATPLPEPISPSCMPGATFVADVGVPDGTEFVPGESFSKSWRISSSGCAPWPTGTRLILESGDRMDGPDTVDVPETPLGNTVDIAVPLTAPASAGTYRGYWQMQAPDGTRFGDRFYVVIAVH